MISFQSMFFIISKSESKFPTGAYAITLSQVRSEALYVLDEIRLNYTGKIQRKLKTSAQTELKTEKQG